MMLEAGEYIVYIYGDMPPNIPVLLKEAQHRGTSLTGPYSVQKHSPHTPKNDYHLHLYHKNNHLLAINKDGTAHDQSHGCTIPAVAADALRAMFPGYTIPGNNLIESSPTAHYLLYM